MVERAESSKGRKLYIDTLKFIAIFIIFATHFIEEFHPQYFQHWYYGKSSLFLQGITGKLGASIFGACLGFFASQSKEDNTTTYIVKRYIYFFLSGLVVNILWTIAGYFRLVEIPFFDSDSIAISVKILVTSLKLRYDIFPTFWCIYPFFLGSVLSYVNGKARVSAIGIVFQIVFFMMIEQLPTIQPTWVSVCLCGALAAELLQSKVVVRILSKKWIRVLLYPIIFILIQRQESPLTYLIDALMAALLIMTLETGTFLKRVLSIRVFSDIGRRTMGIFLIHPLIFRTVGKWLFNVINFESYWPVFLLVFVICWLLVIAVAYPVNHFINTCVSSITKYTRAAIVSHNWSAFLS